MVRKFTLLTLILGFCYFLSAHTVDLIIFSKDRPLQLYGLLESLAIHAKGFNKISVLCHAKDERITHAYEQVGKEFPAVEFAFQSRVHPHGDFKQLLCLLVDNSQAQALIFAVDDMVVTGAFDIQECAQVLEQTKAYGFYLHMGQDITESFTEGRREGKNRISGLPVLQKVTDSTLIWRFDAGKSEWCYPNSVDMVLYPKVMVAHVCHSLSYFSPNSFELEWAERTDLRRCGLCFTSSKTINIPLNIVQSGWNTEVINIVTVERLLELFERGYKMDVAALYQYSHKAPHIELIPTFIHRK